MSVFIKPLTPSSMSMLLKLSKQNYAFYKLFKMSIQFVYGN